MRLGRTRVAGAGSDASGPGLALRARLVFVGAASGGAAAPLALARAALDTLQAREALSNAIEAPRASVW